MAKSYGTLPRDQNQVPIMSGSGILTADSTASPQNSPLAIDTNVVSLTVPSNAAELTVSCDVAIRISNVANMATYFTVPGGAVITVPVSRTDSFYIRTGSGSGTLQFMFFYV